MSSNLTNESINQTNSTIWNPDLSKIPNVDGVIKGVENNTLRTLELWGLDAFHTVFTILLFAAGIIALYYTFVIINSKSSGVFKYIFYIVITGIILVLFDVI